MQFASSIFSQLLLQEKMPHYYSGFWSFKTIEMQENSKGSVLLERATQSSKI